MVHRNPHIAALESGYLFPEIRKRKETFLKENPHAKIIGLGIGDTTEPITPTLVRGMVDAAQALGTKEGYCGYPPEAGDEQLKALIAEKIYSDKIAADDIFISDGSKCDVGRLQVLFGQDVTIAVQDPVYPVYVDTSRILGQRGVVSMPCVPENNFFPTTLPKTDLIYFCSPNNPTGAVADEEQLLLLVEHAKKNRSIILFDAAYAAYVQEGAKSIYEIPGAQDVAIEMGSFSKMAGFTGVRLGWTVVPGTLTFSDGSPVQKDWSRVISTFFNGASHVASQAGRMALSPNGLKEIKERVAFYLENAKIISEALKKAGLTLYGGRNIPYIWCALPGVSSWDLFEHFLSEAHLLTIPGSGFGPGGEGFVRISAFGHREDIVEAATRIREVNDDINSRCDSEHFVR